MLDIPLDEVIGTHMLTQSAFTILAKEYDMNKKSKGPKMADVEATDIWGLTGRTSD